MAPEQISQLIHALEKSQQEFQAACAAFTEEQARIQPEPGRWSALECVEHVVVAEELFLGRLEAAPRLESPRMDKQKEAELAIRVVNRANRAEAPERSRPAGRFASLAQAMQRFHQARARTIGFAEQRAADLYWLSVEHPRFGSLNGAEYMMIIAGHAQRHAAQITEVKSALGIL
ncbi:MAG TPA: DinB family protein [Bryobacteraceae bacterium]|nr:DinB family protein [Bryobacteraceae bacterium]